MFEWSKEICKKIKDADCLKFRELQKVEVALRLYELQEFILDEFTGVEDSDMFELEYSNRAYRKKYRMEHECGS